MDAKQWQAELDREESTFKDFRKSFDDLVKRYRDDERTKGNKFNIFWSNVETLKPVAYGRTPEPSVRRRYLDSDPIGMVASEIVQRALSWNVDDNDFHREMERVRDDMLIGGRGVARIKYNAEFGRYTPTPLMLEGMEEPYGYEFGGEMVEPEFDDEGPYVERKEKESVYTCHVHWRDFKCDPARSWEEVRWVAFRHLMTKADLKKAFGRKAEKVNVNYEADPDKENNGNRNGPKYACVWEIWDKRSEKRIWIAEGHDKILDEEPDPLKLEGFFPCPEPACLIKTTDTLKPVAEFMIYQDQADELNEVTQRISKLVRAAQAKGLYAGDAEGITTVINDMEDGQLASVADAQALAERGGLKGNIWYMPINEIVQVITGLTERERHLKQQIYEISGISDIMRGATRASETAAAQQLKGQFAAVRTGPRSEPMRRMTRELYRMMAEVMCRFFSPQEWQRITGQPVPPEVTDLMRDPQAFEFRIDIETDATVAEDASQKKSEAVEFVTAFTQYLQAASQIVAGAPETAPMMGEIAKWTLRRFGSARDLEKTISDTMDGMAQKAQQPQTDPKAEAEKAKMQLEVQKAQLDMQIEQMKMKADQEKAGAELKLKRDEMVAELQLKREQIAAEIELKRQQMGMDAEIKREQTKMSAKPAVNLDIGEKSDQLIENLTSFAQKDSGAAQQAASMQMEAARTQSEAANSMAKATEMLAGAAQMMARAASAPKRIIRGADGRAEGVETMVN